MTNQAKQEFLKKNGWYNPFNGDKWYPSNILSNLPQHGGIKAKEAYKLAKQQYND
jgi:hypothetical protein